MRRLKIILAVLLGSLLGLVALMVITLALIDESFYRKEIVQGVEALTGDRFTIAGPVRLRLLPSPSARIAQAELASATGDYALKAREFDIRLDLLPLFWGKVKIRRLVVDGATMDLDTTALSPEAQPTFAIMPVELAEAHLKDTRLRIHSEAGRPPIEIELTTTTLRGAPGEALASLKAEGEMAGTAFRLEGRLGRIVQLLRPTEPYPLELTLMVGTGRLGVAGTVDHPMAGQGLHLHLTATAPELTATLKSLHVDAPVLGELGAQAWLQGDLSAPQLRSLESHLRRDPGVDLHVTGSVDDLLTQTGTDIQVSGRIHDPAVLAWLLPRGLPGFDHLALDGRALKTQADQPFRLEGVAATLSDPKGLHIQLKGHTALADLASAQPFRDMDVALHFTSPTTEAAKVFLFEALPELGPVDGTARLTSPPEDLAVEDIDIALGKAPAPTLSMRGRIGRMPLDADIPNTEITLRLELKAEHSQELGELFGRELPELGPVRVAGTFEGSKKAGRIGAFSLQAGRPKGLSLTAEGGLALGDIESDQPIASAELELRLNSPNTRTAAALIGDKLPELGAIQAQARLQGGGQRVAADKVRIQVGRRSNLKVIATGRVGAIPITGEGPVGDMDLRVDLAADRVARLAQWLDIGPFPEIGPLQGYFKMTGRTDRLGIDDARVTWGRKKGLMLSASGRIKDITFAPDPKPTGVNIRLAAEAPASTALSSLMDWDLPDLGQVFAEGRLTDSQGSLGIGNMGLRVGPKSRPVIKGSGYIEDLLGRKGIRWDARFEVATTTLFPRFSHRSVHDLGQTRGRVRLSDADGSLGLESFALASDRPEHLAFHLQGAFDDLLGRNEINMTAKLSAQDISILGALAGKDLPPLGPVSAQGRLSGDDEALGYRGIITLGKTRVTTRVSGSLTGKRPSLKGTIQVPHLYLADLGIAPETESEEHKQEHKPAPTGSGPLFSRRPLPFEALRDLDLSLQLKVGHVIGTDLSIRSIDASLNLVDGRLTLKPATMVFEEGALGIDMGVDARGPTPTQSLKVIANNIRFGELIHQFQSAVPARGRLEVNLDVSSRGRSPHEIASHLNGHLGLAVEDAEVLRRQLNLFASDYLGWAITTATAREKYIPLECLSLALSAKNGIMHSDTLFIDGPNLTTHGKAEVDLAQETLDVVLLPKKKNRLWVKATPVHITGPIADPKVRAIPVDQAALLVGTVGGMVLAPYIFVPAAGINYLWGLVKSMAKKPDRSPCLERALKAQ
jgi:uncharacterized protein involved in outer membrane biogenesis